MEKEHFIFIFIMIVLFGMIGNFWYLDGSAKKELIFEKTGKEISWIKASGYPNEYFINADIKQH